MTIHGRSGCAGPAGWTPAARGVKARQIQRLAVSILRRLQKEPDLMRYMVRTYINNASFSMIRPELIRELVLQAEGMDLPCKVKMDLIAPLRAQTELQQRSTSPVGV